MLSREVGKRKSTTRTPVITISLTASVSFAAGSVR